MVENLRHDRDERMSEMNQEPQPAREGASRDGLAAVAIVLVAAILIAVLVSQII